MTQRKFSTLPATIALIAVIVILGAAMSRSMRYFYRAAYPTHYSSIVLAESARQDIPPELVFAVIHTESGFNPDATSHVEARGLMQITEETFEWAQMRLGETGQLTFDELYEPHNNIRYGTVILRLLLDEFGSERLAICAYHAGWGSVSRWLKDERYSPDGTTIPAIPSAVTAGYVNKVLDTKDTYQTLYEF